MTFELVNESIPLMVAEYNRAKAIATEHMDAALRAAWTLGNAIDGLSAGDEKQVQSVIAGSGLDLATAKRLVRFRRKTDPSRMAEAAQGWLALELPPKQESPAETVRTLPHISGAVAAWNRYVRAVNIKHLELDRDAVKRETREMFLWLQSIHDS